MNKSSVDNTKSQMRKGVLEFCILSLLKQKEAYVSDIIDELKSSKLIVIEGTLYPMLTRLKNDGYLTYRWIESNSGPPRKYYKLTPEGETVLGELIMEWNELVNSINNIIKTNNHE